MNLTKKGVEDLVYYLFGKPTDQVTNIQALLFWLAEMPDLCAYLNPTAAWIRQFKQPIR